MSRLNCGDRPPRSPIGSEQDLALSLCGCGFLGVYHCGAIKCLMRHGTNVLNRCKVYTGASAGALVAALMLCNRDSVEPTARMAMDTARHVRSLKYGLLTSGFSLNQLVYDEMNRRLPEDAHHMATNRLFISMTDKLTLTSRMESQFESRDKLLRCLAASSYIPLFSGLGEQPPEIDGRRYIDGGITLNMPIFPNIRTITVSPFHCDEADVSPVDEQLVFDWTITVGKQKIQFSYNNFVRGKQALMPPSEDILNEYFDRGFVDMMIFLKKNKVFERPEGTDV